MAKIWSDYISGYSCHCCGATKIPVPVTRIIEPDTPEFELHRPRGGRLQPLVDIELSGYDYYCPVCGNETRDVDQESIHRIQKKKGDPVLTQYEIQEKVPQMKTRLYYWRVAKRYAWVLIVVGAFLLWKLIVG